MYFLFEIGEKSFELPYNEILTIISGLYVGLIALMYPKIYEFQVTINKESHLLYDKLSKCFTCKYGYLVMLGFIAINILSFFVSNSNYKLFFISFNIISVFTILLMSYCFYNGIYKDYTINIKKLLYDKNIEKFDKDKVLLLQEIILRTFNNSNSVFYLNKNIFYDFVQYIFKYFIFYKNYILEKEERNDENFINNLINYRDKYYLYPLERIQYISQELIRYEINEIDYILVLTDSYFETIVNFYLETGENIFEEEYFVFHNMYIEPLLYFEKYLLYKIKNNFFKNYEIHYLTLFLKLYIKLEIDYRPTNKGICFEDSNNIQKYVFLLIKNIIDYNYSDDYVINFIKNTIDNYFAGKLDKDNKDKKEYKLNIIFREDKYKNEIYDFIFNINVSILSYLFKIKKYDLLIKCVNLVNCNSVNCVAKYLIYKNISIFNRNNLLKVICDNNEYKETNNKNYKYYVIFIFLINIKNSINLELNELKKYKNNNNKNKMEMVKHCIKSTLEFKLKDNLSLDEIQYIQFNKIDELLESFFKKDDFLNLFDYDFEKNSSFFIDLNRIEEYKKFITGIFRLLFIKVENYKSNQ